MKNNCEKTFAYNVRLAKNEFEGVVLHVKANEYKKVSISLEGLPQKGIEWDSFLIESVPRVMSNLQNSTEKVMDVMIPLLKKAEIRLLARIFHEI